MVETIALKPEPIFFNEYKKNKSPITIPTIPLYISNKKSLEEKPGKPLPITRRVKVNPVTPTAFFNRLICIAPKRRPDRSKRITADDQQNAVSNAYISPELKFIFIYY